MKVQSQKTSSSATESRLSRIGVDLAKDSFHVVGLDAQGHKIYRRKFNRESLKKWLERADLPRLVVAMEACGGSQWWGGFCQSLGHEPLLIPPHQVKPFATGQKNDMNDAEAIVEASLRPKTSRVPVKTPEQQDLTMLLASRQGFVRERTRLIARIRAFLMERGITFPKGKASIEGSKLSRVLDDGMNELTQTARTLLRNLQEEVRHLTEKIAEIEAQIAPLVRTDETSRRLQTIPGIGPLIAAALIAIIGDPRRFASGRDMAAYIGLVPRQDSTGGKVRLGRITKKGDDLLRSLLVEGAKAALRSAMAENPRKMKKGKLQDWIQDLKSRKDLQNKVTVAYANKMVRMAWAIWTKGTTYQAAA